jgi:hypothetical protein
MRSEPAMGSRGSAGTLTGCSVAAGAPRAADSTVVLRPIGLLLILERQGLILTA